MGDTTQNIRLDKHEEAILRTDIKTQEMAVVQATHGEQLKNIGSKIDTLITQDERRNNRIGKLESWKDKFIGAWKLVGIVGAVLAIIGSVLKMTGVI